jgi:valyl-tRNA synthetase
MAGLIDVGAERLRVNRLMVKAEGDIQRVQAQIDNPNFMKAPAHIQAGAREQLARRQQDLEELKKQLERLNALEPEKA